MKSVFIDKPYSVTIKTIERPKVEENEVLIKVKAAGICGSDIHTYKGLHPFRKPPVSIGHELAGEIVEVGSNVKHLKVGDAVTVEPQDGCRECEYCLSGNINQCDNREAPGVKDWLGAMSEFFVAHKNVVFKLPDGMSYEEGVLVEPLAVGVHAVRKGRIKLGDRVAILGSGPIGLLSLVAAKAAGAQLIVATDVQDYTLQKAKEFGANYTINASEPNWIEKAKELASGGFDCVIVAVGIKGIMNQSLSLLKKGGRSVAVAMFQSEEPLDIVQLQQMEKEMIGSFTYNREDMVTAIQLLDNDPSIKSIISHVLSVDEAEYGFKIVEQKEDNPLKVIVTFE